MGKRHVIAGKSVSHKGITLTSDADGNVTFDIPGQPHLALSGEEYLHILDMGTALYDWDDE